MAIDLGDPYPLAVFVTDDLGAAANAGNVTVTVTLPDLTVATPAVVNDTVGAYTAAFVTSQAGRHTVRWVATGVNACAFEDEFNVDPADAGQIISLDDARAGLGKSASDRVKDEDLRVYIAAATPVMEYLIGSILRTTRVETYDGGSTQIVLLNPPLISVTSVIESYGAAYVRALTAQDIFTGGGADGFGYTIDLASGLLTRRASGIAIPFPRGNRNVQVTYVAGRVLLKSSHNIATRIVVKQMWQADQQGYRPSFGAPDSGAVVTPTGFLVPNRAVELCAGDLRGPGLA